MTEWCIPSTAVPHAAPCFQSKLLLLNLTSSDCDSSSSSKQPIRSHCSSTLVNALWQSRGEETSKGSVVLSPLATRPCWFWGPEWNYRGVRMTAETAQRAWCSVLCVSSDVGCCLSLMPSICMHVHVSAGERRQRMQREESGRIINAMVTGTIYIVNVGVTWTTF